MRPLLARFLVCSLFGLFVVTCGDDDGGSGDASAPPPPPAGDSAVAGDDGSTPPPPPIDGAVPPPVPPPSPRIERLIRGDVDTRLVLEVDSVPGFEPRAGVVDQAAMAVAPLLDKPDGITSMPGGTVASRGEDHAWTVEELHETANATFDLEVPAGTIKLHVLFVDGFYANESPGGRTLGVALNDTHVVLFKARLTSTCRSAGAGPLLEDELCTLAEVSVLVHEIGHAIGLVNNGLAMVTPHEDTAHPAHDTNRECVMYWAYEGGDLLGTLLTRLIGGNRGPLPFDDACRADVAAIRDR